MKMKSKYSQKNNTTSCSSFIIIFILFFLGTFLFSILALSPLSSTQSRFINGPKKIRRIETFSNPIDIPFSSTFSASSASSQGFILVLEKVKLTGAPPLVSRTDIAMDPNFVPDFSNSGLSNLLLRPSIPIFFMASFDSIQSKKGPLAYARLTEDAVRDVIIAIISSPGRPWTKEAEEAMKEFKHKAPRREIRNKEQDQDKQQQQLMCRAGPVTSPYYCLASLQTSRPTLFSKLKSSQSSKIYIIDAGNTLAGYFGLLAAASAAGEAGIQTLVIDSQPQCIEWAKASAAASGFSESRFKAINAHLIVETESFTRKKVRVPIVTNCRGSTTQGGFIENLVNLNNSESINVPQMSLSEILGIDTTSSIILLLKLDVMGREKIVLDGLGQLLDEKRVLNVIFELNKQRAAVWLKLASAIKVDNELLSSTSLYKESIEFEKEAIETGALPSQAIGEANGLILSDFENDLIAKLYADLISIVFLKRGYECLTADRGWWSAQSPFRPNEETTQDGETLEKWSKKMNRVSEVDVWCYLSATREGEGE